jgi:hypothetical protein
MTDADRTTLLITGAVRHSLEMMQREGPMASLICVVDPTEGADHATVVSGDGLFRASVPLDWLRTARIEAGRLRVPDAPARCWSVKDVVAIRFTVGAEPDSVPNRAATDGGQP